MNTRVLPATGQTTSLIYYYNRSKGICAMLIWTGCSASLRTGFETQVEDSAPTPILKLELVDQF